VSSVSLGTPSGRSRGRPTPRGPRDAGGQLLGARGRFAAGGRRRRAKQRASAAERPSLPWGAGHSSGRGAPQAERAWRRICGRAPALRLLRATPPTGLAAPSAHKPEGTHPQRGLGLCSLPSPAAVPRRPLSDARRGRGMRAARARRRAWCWCGAAGRESYPEVRVRASTGGCGPRSAPDNVRMPPPPPSATPTCAGFAVRVPDPRPEAKRRSCPWRATGRKPSQSRVQLDSL